MVSEKGIEFVGTVWLEKRASFGILRDDFVGISSRFEEWKTVCKCF